MAGNDDQERTEEPTARRREQAREKGQIARSRELSTMLLMLTAGVGGSLMGPGVIDGLLALMHRHFTPSRAQIFDPQAGVAALSAGVYDGLLTVAPLLVLLSVAALAAPGVLGGWTFSLQSLGFKWDKLDPIRGLKRVFAWRGLIELFKALLKFVLIGAVAVGFLHAKAAEFIGLGFEPLHQAIAHAGDLLLSAFLLLGAALVLIAAADVPFQLWDHKRQLRMSHQEVKDEHKQTEGSPETRSRVRGLQREMAQRRMMAEVPEADVVITNPQHYAVALRYRQERHGAPVVVAKGADSIAAKIREIAVHHRVPLLAAPPLARALYHTTELEREIPAGLYIAVAKVLAYVFQLKRAGTKAPHLDVADLPIPDDLRYD